MTWNSSPFPLRSAGRYLVGADQRPFPVFGDSAWFMTENLSPTDQATYLADRISRGFTATLCDPFGHKFDTNKPPLDFASNLPFSKRLDGATFTGSPNGTTGANGNAAQYSSDNYSTIATQGPDFTNPNETFWARVKTFVALCAASNQAVFMFASYVGFGGGDEGWMAEMVANDAITGAGGLAAQPYANAAKSQMWNYGAWLATEFSAYSNIVWVIGGDYGDGSTGGTFTLAQKTAVDNLDQGMRSVGSALSKLRVAHWSRGSFSSSVALTSAMDLESGYSGNTPADTMRTAYSHNAGPTIGIENRYENDAAGSAPYRKYLWWQWTSGAAGAFFGNNGPGGTAGIYLFESGWQSLLASTTAQDAARMHAILRSIKWWALGASSIVASGGSTSGNQDYISAATDSATVATLVLLYVPPAWASGTFSLTMTQMSGSSSWIWKDPTGFAADSSAGSGIANTGTHTFTPPSAAGRGDSSTDWVLLGTVP